MTRTHSGAAPRALALLAALLTACTTTDPETHTHLTVALSPDIPPYVIDGATSGIEVDIIRLALPDEDLHFIQIPYDALQSAVERGAADVAVGVQQFDDDGAFYSRDLVTFENAAITKKSAQLTIGVVADLAGHRVLTWQDACLELGPEFQTLYAPGGPQRAQYVELADQYEQVRLFWEAEADIAVIDRSIFEYFTKELGHSASEVEEHLIFPPNTDFKAAFKDADLRDAFDRGLAALCESGEYAKVLVRHGAKVSRTICDP